MDSKGFSDKSGKCVFLDKMINYVGICTGQAINARSNKVVAGLEPGENEGGGSEREHCCNREKHKLKKLTQTCPNHFHVLSSSPPPSSPAEATNMFLAAMGRVATNSEIDHAEATKRTLNNESPGDR